MFNTYYVLEFFLCHEYSNKQNKNTCSNEAGKINNKNNMYLIIYIKTYISQIKYIPCIKYNVLYMSTWEMSKPI